MQVHSLTTQQLRKLTDAVGNGSDFPKITDDPRVNHAVDCIVADEDEEPEYDEQLGIAEVEAFRARGSFASA